MCKAWPLKPVKGGCSASDPVHPLGQKMVQGSNPRFIGHVILLSLCGSCRVAKANHPHQVRGTVISLVMIRRPDSTQTNKMNPETISAREKVRTWAGEKRE